jgi:hypothetical protein
MLSFWQKLGASAILSAALDLVVTAERMKNPNADLRLQRHIAVLRRLRPKPADGHTSDKRDLKRLLKQKKTRSNQAGD